MHEFSFGQGLMGRTQLDKLMVVSLRYKGWRSPTNIYRETWSIGRLSQSDIWAPLHGFWVNFWYVFYVASYNGPNLFLEKSYIIFTQRWI